MKYKNYTDLIAAYKSGELTAKTPLRMDNDDCHVYVGDVCVFRGNGECDAVEIAEAAGIPCEVV